MEQERKSELERIGALLKIKQANNLCLSIQSKINKLISENDKMKFSYSMVCRQNERLKKDIDIMQLKAKDYTYLDEFKEQMTNTFNILRNENFELNQTIVRLKQEIDYYRDKERKI